MEIECGTISADSIRKALERIQASPTFARSQQLRRFLEVTVTRTLAGRENELKEYAIAVDVCGRRPSHDSRIDPIVRTEAQRLRQKLAKYDEREGANEDVRILYPKGSYVPTFTSNVDSAAKPQGESAETRVRTFPRLPLAGMVTAAVLAIVSMVLAGHARTDVGTSVAVLTFQDLSQSRDREALALATTEALIVRLTREPDLAVIVDPSALSMAATQSPGVAAGATPRADYRLRGSVQRSGDRYRVTAQLIRVNDETTIWAESYTFDGTGSFLDQDTVADDVARKLRNRVLDGRPDASERPLARLGSELITLEP